jgi:hypothetical protein
MCVYDPTHTNKTVMVALQAKAAALGADRVPSMVLTEFPTLSVAAGGCCWRLQERKEKLCSYVTAPKGLVYNHY